jgi:hypothetical protein
MIEYRIKRFQELSNNKWFYKMNWSLDIISEKDPHQKYMKIKYGYNFHY